MVGLVVTPTLCNDFCFLGVTFVIKWLIPEQTFTFTQIWGGINYSCYLLHEKQNKNIPFIQFWGGLNYFCYLLYEKQNKNIPFMQFWGGLNYSCYLLHEKQNKNIPFMQIFSWIPKICGCRYHGDTSVFCQKGFHRFLWYQCRYLRQESPGIVVMMWNKHLLKSCTIRWYIFHWLTGIIFGIGKFENPFQNCITFPLSHASAYGCSGINREVEILNLYVYICV